MPKSTLSVTKEFTFDAAHQLLNGYVGKCAEIHGHTYKLQVTINLSSSLDTESGLDQFGMVVNFDRVKEAWKEIELKYDHKNLNDTLGVQTTAENIVQILFSDLRCRLNKEGHFYVSHIRLYETPTSWVDFYQEEENTFKKNA